MTSYITIPPERAGLELDEFLCLTFPLLNKGFLRSKVREGTVLVDGMKASPSQRLREYQVLVVNFEEEEELPDAPVAPALRIPVLYEDEHVIAVDKPSALAAEPERWAKANASLSGALLSLALERSEVEPVDPTEPTPGLSFRPRLLHRLDKDTTGVVLVAKSARGRARAAPGVRAGHDRQALPGAGRGRLPARRGRVGGASTCRSGPTSGAAGACASTARRASRRRRA